MNTSLEQPHFLTCSCGKLQLPARGVPIMSAACFCSSCQTAGEYFASFGHGGVKGADGGTPFVLYRKDFVDCSGAAEGLCEHRLKATSTTRRVLSTCCQTPMFLEFESGHWLSVYADRVPGDLRPAIEIRTMVKDAPPGTHFDDDVPSYRTHSVGFMLRLLWAWARMGFRAPRIDVRGTCGSSTR